jgi:hypothetical protein
MAIENEYDVFKKYDECISKWLSGHLAAPLIHGNVGQEI